MLSNSRDLRVRGLVVTGDVRDRHPLLAGLDDRLERVGELRDDRHAQRGFSRVGPEAARRVGDGGVRDLPHHPAAERLQLPLAPRHVLQLGDVAIADDEIGRAAQQRREQLADIAAGVLIVGVGVDDEIGVLLQRRVDAGHERRRQPLVPRQPHDVMDAVRARDVGGAVLGAVVDDEDLDHVDAGHGRRQVCQRGRQRVGLVQARNLDDQFFHWVRRVDYGNFRRFRNQPTSFSITPSHVMSTGDRMTGVTEASGCGAIGIGGTDGVGQR